jgi:hypothetical protein
MTLLAAGVEVLQQTVPFRSATIKVCVSEENETQIWTTNVLRMSVSKYASLKVRFSFVRIDSRRGAFDYYKTKSFKFHYSHGHPGHVCTPYRYP